MKNDLSNLLSTKNNEIETTGISIKENLLKFSDITIQLSNISYLSAGKKKLKIPLLAIITVIISLILLSVIPLAGFILLIISGVYIWYIYNDYQKSKQFLTFNLNSGQTYHITFQKADFLSIVKETVELSMNNKNKKYEINIQEQKVFSGDYHTHTIGNNVNINSNNSEKTDSSITIGDIKNNAMSGVAFGSDNTIHVNSKSIQYDWAEIKSSIEHIISTTENPLVKEASIEVLEAAQSEDKKQFESIVKNNKSVFLSELFQNTASQILATYIKNILGI
ncbi:hypothetical protein G4229_10075 [Listeria seeligeri]|uniref:hypothetical protein n=1 Tax=Listeria seeligeri TaxID=1640 RepID=UPI001889BB83|nr:hypothetical protein [Listeria seeligeri]MBF2654687.1 hypothetical protein [Listeria seeligeri]MBT0134022.1 hypothetical protein [Listeria seeligeri]